MSEGKIQMVGAMAVLTAFLYVAGISGSQGAMACFVCALGAWGVAGLVGLTVLLASVRK